MSFPLLFLLLNVHKRKNLPRDGQRKRSLWKLHNTLKGTLFHPHSSERLEKRDKRRRENGMRNKILTYTQNIRSTNNYISDILTVSSIFIPQKHFYMQVFLNECIKFTLINFLSLT